MQFKQRLWETKMDMTITSWKRSDMVHGNVVVDIAFGTIFPLSGIRHDISSVAFGTIFPLSGIRHDISSVAFVVIWQNYEIRE